MQESSLVHALGTGSGCACSSAGPLDLTGGPRKYERNRPFQVRHVALDIELDFDAREVRGAARLDCARVDGDSTTLELDAIDFELAAVMLISSGKETKAKYRYDGERIQIAIGKRLKEFSVEIRYSAEPRRGLYFLAPDRAVPERPKQVWSQCQDEDARFWFPCHDKPHQKMTTELRVKVPAGMTVLSNGELVSSRTPSVKAGKGKARAPKTWSYHFKLEQPQPSYLVTLVAGHFDVMTEQVALGERSVAVAYYVPPGKQADGKRAFSETPRMIQLFSQKTGVPYPYGSYSQIVVSDFIFGGMENTTATTMEEEILLDAKAARDVDSNYLVAHELAHQWFGDYVTCRDWSHAWLNEGFAMFMELVEREDRLGADEYAYALRRNLNNYLGESSVYRRAIVCRDYDNPIDLFDRHLYEKGSLVLHLLCRELGEERFWRGVKLYLERHAGGIVETNDLMRALESVSGRSLERFFDSWVYRPGHPTLKLKISYSDGYLNVDLKQTQRGNDVALFDLPLCVEVALSESSLKRHERRIDEAQGSLTVAMSEAPLWVEVDPDYLLLGRVDIDCPVDMLERQLASGPRGKTRWVAAELLGKKGGRRAIRALAACLANEEEAWMVRAEAAHGLGRTRDERARAALLEHVGTSDDRVRRAVMWGLGNFRHADVEKALLKHARRDASYLVQAQAARSLGKSRGPSARAALEKLLAEESWADVVRGAACNGLSQLGDEAALPSLLETTQYGVPTRGRRAAILALPELSQERRVRRHLEELLEDPHPHVRGDVARALQSLGDPVARAALRGQLTRENDGRVRRRLRGAIDGLTGSGKSVDRRLSRDVESLREKLEALEAKLGRLEQKKGKSK
ncbi:MAG: HEAT repeat domain-containing protein [Myxococcales bacterium]|nr:HEAT repeat domain-containing protein [Myxococcales bacterium]